MHRFLSAHTPVCHNIESVRLIETTALADLPTGELMQRAGQSLCQLALAVAPHARTIWIACGPGNNGGDGMQAAIQLKKLKRNVIVTWFGDMRHLPSEAKQAFESAMEIGVTFSIQPPENLLPGDLCIDALLGIGANRAPKGKLNDWLFTMRSSPADLISVDIPSGLDADSGAMLPSVNFSETTIMPSNAAHPLEAQRAVQHPLQHRYTLTFLTGKPGLLTGEGLELAGDIWLDDLGASDWVKAVPADWVINRHAYQQPIRHQAHKGTQGDVLVVGGAGQATAGSSMAGACTLAGAGALFGGSGRVYLHLLDSNAPLHNPVLPELMYRRSQELNLPQLTAVCGCGGGLAIANALPDLLTDCKRVVLDADALNAIAADPALRTLVQYRAQMNWETVLTPHPMEAARLLGLPSATEVQENRRHAVQELVKAFNCVVVLKGSGTLISAPGMTGRINATGNSRLSTAGTGDVLAGYIGALIAQGMPAFEAACAAVLRHGEVADQWEKSSRLTALQLAQAL